MMNALVEQARSYIGVPFKHRGRSRKGVDCAGLVWCSYADLGVVHPDIERYGREPHRNGLMRVVCEALGEPVWQGETVSRAVLQVGDVLVLRFVKEPHHMGIVGDDLLRGLSLIHSYGDIGRVVEHGIDELWQSRICAVFRRPVITYGTSSSEGKVVSVLRIVVSVLRIWQDDSLVYRVAEGSAG